MNFQDRWTETCGVNRVPGVVQYERMERHGADVHGIGCYAFGDDALPCCAPALEAHKQSPHDLHRPVYASCDRLVFLLG